MRKVALLLKVFVITSIIVTTYSITMFAGTWEKTEFSDYGEWIYSRSSPINQDGWKWIDGDKDGVFECYYLKGSQMAQNTMVDGYTINRDGQWVVNGVTQIRKLPNWIKTKNVEKIDSTGEFVYPYIIYMKNLRASAKINDTIGAFINNEKKEYNDAEIHYTDYDYILGNSKNTDSRYIGIALNTYKYYGDTANGMGSNTYYTITPDKGILDISDIGEEQIKTGINNYVRNALKARMVNEGLKLYDEPENISVRFDGDWMLTSEGVYIIFNQDEIAPHFEGDIEIVIPYDDIKMYLNSYGKAITGIN